ncbi:MAG: DEAD/DEAH box helicase, partial [Patescibacteria group bacterium]
MAAQHKKASETKVSYHKKPANLTTDDWQRELRRQFVADKKQMFNIKYLDGDHPVFADYLVENDLSGGRYKVALRSLFPGPNFCDCLDFKTNTLGTCKHIESILQNISKNKKMARLSKENYEPAYSSVFLKYGAMREVMLRIGACEKDRYEKLAKEYFDENYRLLPETFGRIEKFLEKAKQISSSFRCYPDAIDFIIAQRENRLRQSIIDKKIMDKYFDSLIHAKLYPYQKEGIIFAARSGRSLIADEMGLGKTIQAIGAAEFFKKEFGIQSVLIVCPTSLKYQWKSEIEKFTESSVSVIEGNYFARQKQYNLDSFYKIASYNVVKADIESIGKMEPDLVILDEVQRIKNWQTKTAQQVKKIQSKYALVLTGTPIENKLEELYSIVQFLDPFKLCPLYKFLSDHQIHDESGKVVGYRQLNQISKILSDTVIRRTKKQVMSQLPKRTDKNLFVPLTEKQAEIHSEYADKVARLVNKWKRFGFLDEKDRQRLLMALNCMRMVSDSTYILDQETRHDTKIAELMSIIDNVLATKEEKIVIFSQWERMTRLVKAELENRKVSLSYLHGGIPSHKRKFLLDDFHNNPACKVFLSTDAGSVGLNLQCASFMVNLDLPWNPAVLEQRIGRIYRHGQKKNVNVINLISKESIEERLLSVLEFKSSLFSGALDNGEDEIFMGKSKFKRFMNSVEEVSNAPAPAEPVATDVEEVEEIDSSPVKKAKEPEDLSVSPAQELFSAG